MPANEDDLMTVGELARRVGVTVRTIQYYDQKGLLHPSSKSEQNQRLYSPRRRGAPLSHPHPQVPRLLARADQGGGGASTTARELSGALEHRMHELERESVEILRNINTVSSLREHLTASEQRALERLRPGHQRYAEPRGRAVAGHQRRGLRREQRPGAHPRGGQPLAPAHGRHHRGHARRRAARRRARPGARACASSASAACPARSPASSASPTSARKAPSSTTATSTRASSVGRSASSKTRSKRCAVRGAKS